MTKNGAFWLNIIYQIKNTIDSMITYHFMYHSETKHNAVNYSKPSCQLYSLIKDVQMLESMKYDAL